MRTRVTDATLINLPIQKWRECNLMTINNNLFLPFAVKRIFYFYEIPVGSRRGSHAHKQCHQLLIAVSGSFEVEIDDGQNKRNIELSRPNYGLYIPPGLWASENNFTDSTVCLVLASHNFEEEDYIREYENFKNYKND